MVDAPVSGGSEGAERGTLTIFVGGEPEHVAGARPVLETFGKRSPISAERAGQLAKAVNQVMIAGTYATVGEGIALAEAAGLPLDALVEALRPGAAASWVLENRAANMIGNSYPLGFKARFTARIWPSRSTRRPGWESAWRSPAWSAGGGRADRRRARRRGRQRPGPAAPARTRM